MATITYTNALTTNPGLEDLEIFGSPGFGITQTTSTLYELLTVSGFKIQITGTNFVYGVNDFAQTVPTGGTITEIDVFDNDDALVATIVGPFGVEDTASSISEFIGTLLGSFIFFPNPLGALNFLLSGSDTVIGSDSNDHLTAFGTSFTPDTLLGGAGNDILTTFTGASDVMVGGTDDDTFILNGNFSSGLTVHGSAQDGTGGESETDILEVHGNVFSFASITNIDGLRFEFNNTGFDLREVTFLTSQIGPGLVSPTLAVEGNPFVNANDLDVIRVARDGVGPIDLDLSGWTFNNWNETKERIVVDLDETVFADDTVHGTSVGDDIFGGAGNDTLYGAGGSDLILGGIGADSLYGGAGADELSGEAGNDQLFSLLGEGPGIGQQEILNGGADIDFALVDRSDTARSLNLDISEPSLATAVGEGTTIVNVEQIEFHAGSGNDHLTGGALADILIGNAGADFLDGNGGDDNLQGGDGTDTLNGDDGNDTLGGGAGIDILDGGTGDDELDGGSSADLIDGGIGNDILTGGAGSDNLDGGADSDTAVFSGLRSAYIITPIGSDFQVTGPDGTDFLTNIEFAQFDDVTIELAALGDQPPVITSNGGGSSAVLDIGENTTTVTTVAASDADGTTPVYSIVGGDDQARFQIDETTGVLSFVTAPDFESPTDSDGNNSYLVEVQASDGSLFDTQTITVNVTNAIGVTITGSTRADTINATTTVAGQPLPTNEDDTIGGGRGNDTIDALGGNDNIDGGAGNDRITGGAGDDIMTGGAGNDTFVFPAGFGNDVINNFEAGKRGGDVIEIGQGIFADFQDVLANSTQVGSDVVITVNAENSITLAGVSLTSLDQHDFVFA